MCCVCVCTPPDELEQDTPGEVVLLVEAMQVMPITHTQIRMWTRRDPVLALVSRYIFQGWSAKVSEDEDCDATRRPQRRCLRLTD